MHAAHLSDHFIPIELRNKIEKAGRYFTVHWLVFSENVRFQLLHQLSSHSSKYEISILMPELCAGPAEPGVQGVQLNTHFLAPSFSKDQSLS